MGSNMIIWTNSKSVFNQLKMWRWSNLFGPFKTAIHCLIWHFCSLIILMKVFPQTGLPPTYKDFDWAGKWRRQHCRLGYPARHQTCMLWLHVNWSSTHNGSNSLHLEVCKLIRWLFSTNAKNNIKCCANCHGIPIMCTSWFAIIHNITNNCEFHSIGSIASAQRTAIK